MPFNLFERSRYKGRKATLYLFTYGDSGNSNLAYTDHTSQIEHDGITYMPIAIKRGKIVAKSSGDKQALQVRCDISQPIAELFRIFPPASVVNLIVKEGHVNDVDEQYIAVWHGRVVSAQRETPELILSCEPMRTSLRRFGLRRYYQYSCGHVLFSEACGASKAAATVSATVSAINGNVISLAPGWALATRPQFLGGLMEWTNALGDTEIRTVISVNDNNVTISAMPRDLTVGGSVSMIRGCSHRGDGCEQHGNILNYGGCPFIPKKNPVGKTSLFN